MKGSRVNLTGKKIGTMFRQPMDGFLNLLLGPVLFLLMLLLLPDPYFTLPAKGAIGTVVWMAFWWITRPVHIGITGLIPLVVNSLFGFVPVGKILVNYADPIIVLLIGADMITVTWVTWGLDKRIALRSLGLIGTTIKQQITAWFLVSLVLTMFLPNTVVVAILTPVAVSMMKYVGMNDISRSQAAAAILLSVAWGAGLGGFGSPLGGAMNLIVITYIEDMIIGREFMFITWVTRLLPMLVVVSSAILTYMLSFRFEIERLTGTKAFFMNEYRNLPPITKGEKLGLTLFIAASMLSFARPIFSGLLPEFKPAFVFLFFGVLTFMLPGNEGKRLSSWEVASQKMMWGLYFLFAGGIAIGNFITLSGAGDAIAQILTAQNLEGGLFTIAIFVVSGILLSNISSNTAACAILTPIVISVIQNLGQNPVPYVYITLAASNCAFVLPTSVRAIPVGYGLDPKIMFKKGLWAVFISFVVVTLSGYLFTHYWEAFSIA